MSFLNGLFLEHSHRVQMLFYLHHAMEPPPSTYTVLLVAPFLSVVL